MKYSYHFEIDVLPKRPYLTRDVLQSILDNPLQTEIQNDGRIKVWGYSSKYNKYIRIVLLSDRETILTAFFDRDFQT